jgi:hypothetical protein
MKVPEIDVLTDKLLVELDQTKRMEVCREVDRALFRNHGAGVTPFLTQLVDLLIWNYYHIGEVAPFATSHQIASQHWFDQTDPTWQGRPA